MILKNFIKQINYAYIHIFQKKGYWFEIGLEFLRHALAKIKLICQQPAMPQLSEVHPKSGRVPEIMAGSSRGGLAMFPSEAPLS